MVAGPRSENVRARQREARVVKPRAVTRARASERRGNFFKAPWPEENAVFHFTNKSFFENVFFCRKIIFLQGQLGK